MSASPLGPDARTLAADLFERFAAPVLGALARRYPHLDPQLLCDAFVRAVLQLSQNFGRYDPDRGSLRHFLAGAARRELRDLLRSEFRRRRREQEKMAGAVTGEASVARPFLEELADQELAQRARDAIALTEAERRVLELWLRDETDVAVYAAALDLTALPPDEQERTVARVLARLRQRAHRYGQRLRGEGAGP